MKDAERLEVIVEALAHLLCSDHEDAGGYKASRSANRHHTVSPSHFDGFECLTAASGKDFLLIGDNANDQPVWPIDYSVAFLSGPETEWPEGTWQFTRIRTLNPKDWRGKLLRVYPRMIEEASLVSRPNGDHMTTLVPYALVGARAMPAPVQLSGGGPKGLGDYGIPHWYRSRGIFGDLEADDERRMTAQMCVAAGFALRRHYLWSVLLGEGSGPRARFVTDPLGVREAFRLRDIPPGKKRRAALLHWVRQHWRPVAGRSSDADRAFVAAYLRGVWSYTWNGLRCQIEPSIEDMETMAARAERKTGAG